MKPLSGWFRPTQAEPPTLQERIDALSTLSPDVIRETALGSPKGVPEGSAEEPLRVAAIHKLPDGVDLRRLAGLSELPSADSPPLPAALQRAAQERMAELTDAGSIDFVILCDQAKHRPALFTVAALCQDAGRLTQVLASLDDPAQVAQLVIDGPTSRVRQSAAEMVSDPVQLRELLKHARDKDRSVYKILKQKHDALVAVDREAARIESETQSLCASLEQHATRRYDPLYAPTFEHLHGRWRALTPPPPADLQRRADQAADRCREVIAQVQQQAAQQAAEREAAEAAVQAARYGRERELEAAREATAAQAEAEAQFAREAADAREAEEALRAAEKAAAEQRVRQIGALVRMAHGALRDGDTKRAAGLRRAIDEKSPTPGALPPALTRQLQQLDAKLNELKQWKDFAVAPKRIELIEAMEALIGAPVGPQVLADRIKELQREWQTISKGIAADAPADWERFHKASRAAYQPCQEYFEAQAKLRQENLERRKEVLARLASFEAAHLGENPDWRLISQVLREAPQEWRRYFPVERDLGRAVQQEFDASMGRLQAKLDVWYESNAADKQTLIKRARLLLAQQDSRDAIDAVKRLQLEWNETGQVSREQQQSLWKEFREVCDAVFQKRQQAFADHTAGLEANKAKGVALCEQAEQAAALSGPALIEAAAKITEWRTAFEEIAEMPKAESRGLQHRFERALDECQKQLARQRRRGAEQSVTALLEAAGLVRAYEWAVMENAAGPPRETLKTAAETFIAGVQRWPKGGLPVLQETLANAAALSAADTEARERALRTLCIRGEILSETPTPTEDAALRREYQVQRLMQGMGQGSRADEGDWDAMLLEWIRIGAIRPELHASLQERFMRGWAARPSPQESKVERPSRRSTERSADRSVGSPAGRGREMPFGARTRQRRP